MTAGFADEPLVDAEPTPDTGAFAEPASMAERRDHLTEVKAAVAAERERIQRRAIERAAQIRQVPATWAAHAAIALDDFAVLLAAEAAAHD